jgi:hypothetical protein
MEVLTEVKTSDVIYNIRWKQEDNKLNIPDTSDNVTDQFFHHFLRNMNNL